MISGEHVTHAKVKGDLATMLVLASETKKAPNADALEAKQNQVGCGDRI
jgi:hypothetical protein